MKQNPHNFSIQEHQPYQLFWSKSLYYSEQLCASPELRDYLEFVGFFPVYAGMRCNYVQGTTLRKTQNFLIRVYFYVKHTRGICFPFAHYPFRCDVITRATQRQTEICDFCSLPLRIRATSNKTRVAG